MSIAVVVKKDNKIVIGADTLQSFDTNMVTSDNLNESKLRRIGSAILASTGWGLYDNILDDYLKGKKAVRLSKKQDIFMFFEKLWPVLHEKYSFVNNQCDDGNSPFGELDSSFLIATKKRIFYISSDMCVTEFMKFYAVGVGRDYAIGAMHVLYDQKKSAEEIARLAIEATIANNVFCGGNIELIKL
jgi:ATP-dependent protease HslVU (ClpYQ) peptidase subunit